MDLTPGHNLKEEILSLNMTQYHWVFLTHLNKGKKAYPMESYLLRKGLGSLIGILWSTSIQLTLSYLLNWLSWDNNKKPGSKTPKQLLWMDHQTTQKLGTPINYILFIAFSKFQYNGLLLSKVIMVLHETRDTCTYKECNQCQTEKHWFRKIVKTLLSIHFTIPNFRIA